MELILEVFLIGPDSNPIYLIQNGTHRGPE